MPSLLRWNEDFSRRARTRPQPRPRLLGRRAQSGRKLADARDGLISALRGFGNSLRSCRAFHFFAEEEYVPLNDRKGLLQPEKHPFYLILSGGGPSSSSV